MINPDILKIMAKDLADNGKAGNGKLIFSYNPDKNRTLFGGVIIGDLGGGIDSSDWKMLVGGMLFLPDSVRKWSNGTCGYRIDSLIMNYLGNDFWVEDD